MTAQQYIHTYINAYIYTYIYTYIHLHPLHGLEVMSLWQRLLQGNEPHYYGIYTKEELSSSTPYTQLFTEVILLVVRIVATNSWETRDPKPMLHFLETWGKLLLALVLHNILDHI